MTSVAFSTFSSPPSALDGTGFARKTTPVDSSLAGFIPMDRVAVIAANPKHLRFSLGFRSETPPQGRLAQLVRAPR